MGELKTASTNWSFGLTGHVSADVVYHDARDDEDKTAETKKEDGGETNENKVRNQRARADIYLRKVCSGMVYGSASASNGKLGVDWATASPQQIRDVVENRRWAASRATIASLLLNQSHIAGIGVAWGSEVLHHARIYPFEKYDHLNQAERERLINSLISVRDDACAVYDECLDAIVDEANSVSVQSTEITALVEFVNGWYNNLYHARRMHIYKCGHPITVGSRTWWI